MNLQSLDHVEPFTTKDGSTIRELHHTPLQSLAEAALEPDQATKRHYHGRTERTILHDMGQDAATATVVLDDALDLAERVAKAVDEGSFDVRDLGRRARRVLEKTARPAEPEQLF